MHGLIGKYRSAGICERLRNDPTALHEPPFVPRVYFAKERAMAPPCQADRRQQVSASVHSSFIIPVIELPIYANSVPVANFDEGWETIREIK
jgi:hypothetical protein